ncbi:hypothetical protein V5O48_018270 [Marasmius crinis-equi]|uniref:Uncharacterized protein n=1 Tax=Marasmius crinis-equi TaxID=585013 RepID=A0ABR3ELN1_9AGAR
MVRVEDLSPGDFMEVLHVAEDGLPAGSLVHKDIVEAFKQDIPQHERDNIIIVASPSEALRSVYPTINRTNEEIECILDGGSQIIAMDTMIAVGLGINWDPDTTIFMQSANGQLKRTKEMARNVPFVFGDVTVYLQLHIIDGAPYHVLLGRPFDVVTESEIKNHADGFQELIITCPDPHHRATVGTYPRGQGKRIPQRNQEPILHPQEHSQGPPPTSEATDDGKAQSHAELIPDQGEVAVVLEMDENGQVQLNKLKYPDGRTFDNRELAEAFMLVSEHEDPEAKKVMDMFLFQANEEGKAVYSTW